MDEACAGPPETITSSESAMEIDDESTSNDDDAPNCKEREILENEFGKLLGQVSVLRNQKRQLLLTGAQTLSANIKALEKRNLYLKDRLKTGKKGFVKFKTECIRLDGCAQVELKELVAAKETEDDFPVILESLNSSHEEWIQRRTTLGKSVKLCNSWRGIVRPQPHFSWTIKHFSYQKPYERHFIVPEYKLRCKVEIIPNQKATIPSLKLSMKFDDDNRNLRGKPMIMAVVRGRDQLKELKTRMDRLDPVCYKNGRYYYDATIRKRQDEHQCVFISIELFFELPWSVRQVQSTNGMLFWKVEKCVAILSFDGSVLYSPYFLINGSDSYRLQAVLSVRPGNVLRLRLIRRCGFARDEDISDYVVSVTVVKPKDKDQLQAITFSRSTNFKAMEEFVLGKVEELIVGKSFLCRVRVEEQKL